MNPLFTEAHMERAIDVLVNLLKDKNDTFDYNLHDFMDSVGLNNVMPPAEAARFLKYLVGHKWVVWRMGREWGFEKPLNYVYGDLTFSIVSEGDRGPHKSPLQEHTFRRGRQNQKRSFNL